MSYENLFITKLPRELTDADLMAIFSAFQPQSAKIMLDAVTGKSKGFGFVLFNSAEAGFQAYKELNQAVVQYRAHSFPLVIYPSKHDGKIANKANRALYIRNIPLSISQDDVVKFLRSFGNLSYYAMREGSHGNLVWVVYAEYETIEEAETALNLLHGSTNFFAGGLPLLAKFSDTEDAKRARRLRRENARETTARTESPPLLTPPTQSPQFTANLPSFSVSVGSQVSNPKLTSPMSSVTNNNNLNSPIGSSVGSLPTVPSSQLAYVPVMTPGQPSQPAYILQQVIYTPPFLGDLQPQQLKHQVQAVPQPMQIQPQPVQFIAPLMNVNMATMNLQQPPNIPFYVQQSIHLHFSIFTLKKGKTTESGPVFMKTVGFFDVTSANGCTRQIREREVLSTPKSFKTTYVFGATRFFPHNVSLKRSVTRSAVINIIYLICFLVLFLFFGLFSGYFNIILKFSRGYAGMGFFCVFSSRLACFSFRVNYTLTYMNGKKRTVIDLSTRRDRSSFYFFPKNYLASETGQLESNPKEEGKNQGKVYYIFIYLCYIMSLNSNVCISNQKKGGKKTEREYTEDCWGEFHLLQQVFIYDCDDIAHLTTIGFLVKPSIMPTDALRVVHVTADAILQYVSVIYAAFQKYSDERAFLLQQYMKVGLACVLWYNSGKRNGTIFLHHFFKKKRDSDPLVSGLKTIALLTILYGAPHEGVSTPIRSVNTNQSINQSINSL
eukprot:gene5963-4272_t